MPIPFFTSIPPILRRPIRGRYARTFGRIWQGLCIQSWLQSGYQPISVNTRDEIACLKYEHPCVEFRPIPHGFDRPRIVHLLDEAKKSSAELVGLINADCLTTPHQFGNIEGIAIAERVNINNKLRPTNNTCWGLDAFFFNPRSLDKITFDPHYRIGGVWWDYWLPLAFQAAGLPIKNLPPMILHINHTPAMELEKWKRDFPKLIDVIRHIDMPRDLRDRLLYSPRQSFEEIELLGHLIFNWLRSNSEQAAVGYASSLAACFRPAPRLAGTVLVRGLRNLVRKPGPHDRLFTQR
jgi:hypothetical protein